MLYLLEVNALVVAFVFAGAGLIMFGLFAVINYQELQQVRGSRRRWDHDADPWDTGESSWKG